MAAFDYSQVADIYDRYVTADFDVPFFREETSRTAGRVLELMAGTGRLSLPLLESGVRLTCVDSSGAMLGVLRKKLRERGLEAVLVEQDVVRLSLPDRYGLAIIPFNSFSEITDVNDQDAALRSIRACLEEKGRLVVTLHNPPVRRRRIDGTVHTLGPFPPEGDGPVVTIDIVERAGEPAGTVTGTQTIRASKRDGSILWQRVVDIRHRLVEHGEFEGMALKAGYVVDGLIGDYDRSPFSEQSSPFMIWLLRA
jgi:SAM-dependent methyltransferase